MSDEPASEGEKPLGGQGRRRAPTIELAATELAAEQQASTTRDDERVGQPETASLSPHLQPMPRKPRKPPRPSRSRRTRRPPKRPPNPTPPPPLERQAHRP